MHPDTGLPESDMLNFDGETYDIMYGDGVEMWDLTPEFCEKMCGYDVDS